MDNSVSLNKSKGSLLYRFSQKFQFAADKIIPDSMVFCLILTFIVFFAALILTDNSPIDLCLQWYDGMWTQLAFAMQMSLMVIVCAATAKAPIVSRALAKVADVLKNPTVATCVFMIWGYVASFINWAFCTLSCTIFAIEISKRVKGTHFPMLIVAGYCTSCLGQCLGPTASVYALLATEGNYMQETLGGIFTQDVTVYNPINIAVFLTLAILTIVLAVMTKPPVDQMINYTADQELTEEEWRKVDKTTVAGKLNGSRIIMWLVGAMGIVVIVWNFATKGFLGALSLNFIITFFLTCNCFLYSTPSAFVGVLKDCMHLGTEVMFQFPFYGGIAGIMSTSGLASIVVAGLVSISTVNSLPIVAYLSASLVNVFIPSQGGQFIVQGPLLVDAAQQMGANVMTVINAFVYGDEATNLIQPLYIIPALALSGTKLKNVWGIMAFIWFFWTIFTILGFLIFPAIL